MREKNIFIMYRIDVIFGMLRHACWFEMAYHLFNIQFQMVTSVNIIWWKHVFRLGKSPSAYVERNGRHFADMFKLICPWMKNLWVSIFTGSIHSKSSLVEVKTWRRICDKHISIIRLQWVKWSCRPEARLWLRMHQSNFRATGKFLTFILRFWYFIRPAGRCLIARWLDSQYFVIVANIMTDSISREFWISYELIRHGW